MSGLKAGVRKRWFMSEMDSLDEKIIEEQDSKNSSCGRESALHGRVK
jgi:hypothetical protein